MPVSTALSFHAAKTSPNGLGGRIPPARACCSVVGGVVCAGEVLSAGEIEIVVRRRNLTLEPIRRWKAWITMQLVPSATPNVQILQTKPSPLVTNTSNNSLLCFT